MKTSYLFLFLFLLLFGCQTQEAAPSYPLDSPVLVEIKEVMLENKKHLVLSCQTRKSYPCSNFFLKTAFQQTGSRISISFQGVGSDRLCTTSQGPARADLDLGMLPNGQFQLTLSGLESNQGTLTVSETTIQLSFPQPKGIEIVNPVLTR